MKKTYIVMQAIEIEAESEVAAVDELNQLQQWEFPYYVIERNAVNRAAVDSALVGTVEVAA